MRCGKLKKKWKTHKILITRDIPVERGHELRLENKLIANLKSRPSTCILPSNCAKKNSRKRKIEKQKQIWSRLSVLGFNVNDAFLISMRSQKRFKLIRKIDQNKFHMLGRSFLNG